VGIPKKGLLIRDPIKMDDDWGYPYFRKPAFARASSAIGDNVVHFLADVRNSSAKMFTKAIYNYIHRECADNVFGTRDGMWRIDVRFQWVLWHPQV
jgi:hypothetical protein